MASQPRRSRSTIQRLWLLPFLLSLLLAIFLLPSGTFAASPSVSISRFPHLPSKITYFPDSPVCLYHDATTLTVHISLDEGKSFTPISSPSSHGKASILVPHPYDPKTAFILSRETTHWRTSDRGKTWQEFLTPHPPATRAGAPMEFHADPKHWDWVIFTGKKCSMWTPWGGRICHDEAYYTKDGFATNPDRLLEFVMHCNWAKATPEMETVPEAMERIFCIAWEDAREERRSVLVSKWGKRDGGPASGATRLFQSDDFFKSKKMVELDMGRNAKQFAGLGPSKRFLVTALRDSQGSSSKAGTEMALFVTRDGVKWDKAKFPHGSELRENAYTVVDSTDHSIMIDVVDSIYDNTGVLFTSDSTGTQFVESLRGTRRTPTGLVDFEHLVKIDGVGIANTQDNDGEGQVRTVITFDDGSSWHTIPPPTVDSEGKKIDCDPKDTKNCALHLWSVSGKTNVGKLFSSIAPGFVMGVGTVGKGLKNYDECDTFLSVDAGRTWRMVSKDAHKFEFGDQGSVLVIVDDEDVTDHVSYSSDFGKSWQKLNLGLKMRAKVLTTIPDSTSLKFLLVGSQTRTQAGGKDRNVAIFLDFATMKKRKCGEGDMEKWYAQAKEEGSCLMGHKQWYKRRKADSDCFVMDKFHDPEGKEDVCACRDEDYECDFGFARDSKGECVPTGNEHIPEGACVDPNDTYLASSGYRKVPGNTCDPSKGVRKDEKTSKSCSGKNLPQAGKILHKSFTFPSTVADKMYFPDSSSVLVQLADGTVWHSLNDGYSWKQLVSDGAPSSPEDRFLTMALHAYDNKRGYLVTAGQRVYYTTNQGASWEWFTAPLPANGLGAAILDFHPDKSDWLIWTGSRDCTFSIGKDCHAEAWYSDSNGRKWEKVETYVRTCSWGRDKKLKMDPRTIFCESYTDKQGNQREFTASNRLQLIRGNEFYRKKTRVFDAIVGFAVFQQYLVVAEYVTSGTSPSLRLQVSLNGRDFAEIHFPPGMELGTRAYTVLDSVTDAIFLHFTTHSETGSEWGTLLKSNSNGTFYAQSLDFVNRNEKGFVDFEKMLGLDGVAIVNVVNNPDDASVSRHKDLVTRITHNDGGRWKALVPPARDVYGQPYECNQVGCDLHLHGFTERDDPKDTYSSPSAVGLMMGVGNVGRKLAPYRDSDTFLTRDGGFTWEEVHKDAHKWEFGDQGSIIVLVNDEQATDTVLYSLNEGVTWESYSFGEKMRISQILTVPEDTHRRFILLGIPSGSATKTVAIYLDFSALESRKCVLDSAHPEKDDFELWSPSEERAEQCLFGRQTYYYRRKRRADCYVGEKIIQPHSVTRNCACTEADFECEFNHYRDATGKCVLYPGVSPLSTDEAGQCWAADNDGYWYERTNVRKIPYSTCTGGVRPDRGTKHVCPNNLAGHGLFWWATLILCPFCLAGLVGYWWVQKANRTGTLGTGRIRLPDSSNRLYRADSELAQNLASVPRFVLGLASAAFARVSEVAGELPFLRGRLGRSRGSYGGYRQVYADEDASMLPDFEEDELDR
ncbi:related to VPS10 domain-containing receptor SorCS1 precursor [Ustilago bromivora]|uniref:Vacuolar protein sorting/targeting protein 10 n=1 Tax=Ustilago bromivora TaxID=307758 RepID=A0A1K0GBY7_9BASI|nr:related to VPS10 domain-containing receptor SorCS1 precursor [Ustilago bromivora]SYW80500.1 related to VPS10 domain-containing receptor SorCS1 precursor [Ustilago bromivora]